MAHTSDHTDTLYSAGALLLMFISLIIGGMFYATKKEAVPSDDKRVQEQVRPTVVQPTEAAADFTGISEQAAAFKIAIPNDISGLLTDSQGRKTGLQDSVVINDIPHSEYTPDKAVGTVTWIVITDPQKEQYKLLLSGPSDKAVALYAKGDTGAENLELIDISALGLGGATYVIGIDPTIPENPITVQ